MKRVQTRIIVKRGELALRELEMNAITKADHRRFARVRRALVALDREQSALMRVLHYAIARVRRGE